MPDGIYELGSQAVMMKDVRSNLVNSGAIAGGAMDFRLLPQCCKIRCAAGGRRTCGFYESIVCLIMLGRSGTG